MATVTGPEMESIVVLAKKERVLIRRFFESTERKLRMHLEETITDKANITATMAQLKIKLQRLKELDEKILPYVLEHEDEDTVLEEFTAAEYYKDQFELLQAKCDFIFLEQGNGHLRLDDNLSVSQNLQRNFRLPKIELKKFNGDVRNWIAFWGQFRKIHDDDTLDKEDKFQYLLQAMEPGSVAQVLIESFPPSSTNYDKAIEQLKSRFARDEYLIEVYVRELLSLVLQQAMRTSEKLSIPLSSLYDKLETQLRALETLGVTSDKYAAMLFPLAESALPEEILRAWERHRTSLVNRGMENRMDRVETTTNSPINYLQMLLDFLRSEVEGEERISLARQGFSSESRDHWKDQGRQGGRKESSRYGKPGQNTQYTTSALYTCEEEGNCPPQWFSGDWAECDCPLGSQRREVRCLDGAGRSTDTCEARGLPAARRPCSCSHSADEHHPQQQREVQDEPHDRSCVDKIHICKLAVQARLCNYPYYQTHCCDSCRKGPQE